MVEVGLPQHTGFLLDAGALFLHLCPHGSTGLGTGQQGVCWGEQPTGLGRQAQDKMIWQSACRTSQGLDVMEGFPG